MLGMPSIQGNSLFEKNPHNQSKMETKSSQSKDKPKNKGKLISASKSPVFNKLNKGIRIANDIRSMSVCDYHPKESFMVTNGFAKD